MMNNKEVGLRVSPRGSEALSPHGALARDQTGQSASALISPFHVRKTLHLHSHVFSSSPSSAKHHRMEEFELDLLVNNLTFHKTIEKERQIRNGIECTSQSHMLSFTV